MNDAFYKAQKGEFGGKLITTANTHTPDTGTSWCCLEFLAASTVTAITIAGNTGTTSGTFSVAAGTRIEGTITSVTTSGTPLIWAKNKARV